MIIFSPSEDDQNSNLQNFGYFPLTNFAQGYQNHFILHVTDLEDERDRKLNCENTKLFGNKISDNLFSK